MEFDELVSGKKSDRMMTDFVQESRLTLMQRRVTKNFANIIDNPISFTKASEDLAFLRKSPFNR